MVARCGGKDTIVDRRTLNLVLAGMVLPPPGYGDVRDQSRCAAASAAFADRTDHPGGVFLVDLRHYASFRGICQIKEKFVDSGQLRWNSDFPWTFGRYAPPPWLGRSAKRYAALLECYTVTDALDPADDILAALKQIGPRRLSPAYVQLFEMVNC